MTASKSVSRRRFLQLTSAVGMGALVAACTPAGAPAGEAPAAAGDGAAAPAEDGMVELDFVTFYTGADGVIMQGIIDRFNDEHPDINVAFSAPAWGADFVTRLQTSGMAGNPPGVMALHNYEIPPLARFLYNLSDSLETLGIDPENYEDVAFDLPTYQGEMLGLTMSTGTMALYYNKNHFEQAGLDPEAPPTNTAEFIEAATAINALGDDIWGFARENVGWMTWYTMNWQHGGALLNEDGTEAQFSTTAAIESAQLVQSFVNEHGFHPSEPVTAMDLLYTDNLGMVFHGPWNLSRIVESNNEAGTNLGWAPHVQFFDDAEGIHSTSHIYCVSRQDPEDEAMREAGMTLVAWLLENGSIDWAQAQAPTNRAVLEQMYTSENPLVQGMVTWVEQTSAAKFPPYHPQWGQISTALVEGMERIVYQGVDVEATLGEVTDQANALLAAS